MTMAVMMAAAVIASPVSAGTALHRAPRPRIVSFRVLPSKLHYPGGTVVIAARLEHATTCLLDGTKPVVRCSHGHYLTRLPIIPFGGGVTRPFVQGLWLVARGPGGETRSRTVRVTVEPETTPPKQTTCTGPCRFVFPVPDDAGVASIALNSLAQDVPCPPKAVCSASADQQIDDANVTVCAGPVAVQGVYPELAVAMRLLVAGGVKASLDEATTESSAATAMGNVGNLAPKRCATGDMYFDAPKGAPWHSLTFAYSNYMAFLFYTFTWRT